MSEFVLYNKAFFIYSCTSELLAGDLLVNKLIFLVVRIKPRTSLKTKTPATSYYSWLTS